ncbi:MAG: lysophospholipid transporter LplT [Methylomonas sp.]|nr:lysophospholipid transporter LplT [Methylomonas sp.]PPD20499.1 MAG: lysophospholipid transporter LplT [Methylomonas sp.]PPD26821.1 MAG: lysophospholipid transporter LplT [Methylomonas sp.]PPD38685.1 MAG: lysophospholipid transporter LplT [Methylomonas sp.]PPD40818.1 MAG: lysophospholipid transporter LplT [Methylomonas sp.]
MTKTLYPLLIAQFLSVFADNAILFAVIAIVIQTNHTGDWYIPALQSVFLVAFVVLAPWVGAYADNHPKSRVLIVANLVKAAGATLLLAHVEPLLAYCVVGMGGALYSPARYGILPELVDHDRLVKANSWIEGSAILAILTGMVVGAHVADKSIDLALAGTIGLFAISAATALLLPITHSKKPPSGPKVAVFCQEIRSFLTMPRARFAILGASLFWAAAAAVRVILIAWASQILLLHNASDIANLTLFLAIGIIIGAALVPKLIPLEHLLRVRIPACVMGGLIVALGFTSDVGSARVVLLLMGIAGGIFIVPVNATLQEIGKQSIGSGGAVAMQNFFQNVAMLLSVGAYTLAAARHVGPATALLALGGLLIAAMFVVVRHFPRQPPGSKGLTPGSFQNDG